MTELDKNVLTEIEKNKKVEVVVKRDAAAEGTELDLVRVFSNMGKKKRVYAWLVLFCMLVGLAVPLLRAEMAESTESVSAVISFIYPGAKDGLAPDRTTLDVNYVTSSYILQSAMARTHLSASIPVNALERNISIERLLTEETRQNLEVVEKVISEANKDYEKVLDVDYKYDGKYIITLRNGFSVDPDARKKTYLDGSEMAALLNAIIDDYNMYFYDTYLGKELPENDLDSVANTDMDYIERLDAMVSLLNSLSRYCTDETRQEYLEYRSKTDGLSFKEINDVIRLVKTINVDYLYAYVFYNSVTKDKKTMTTKYEYLMKNAERDLGVINGNIKSVAELIAGYKNDSITMAGFDSSEVQMGHTVTDYYNELIMEQAGNYSLKEELAEKIASYKDKVEGFTATYTSASQREYVENELDALVNICRSLYELTERHAEEIIDSDSYKSSYMTFVEAQYFGDSFFNASNIKKAVIGMVIGAVLAVAIWGLDALAEEFKRGSAQKEENKEKEAEA